MSWRERREKKAEKKREAREKKNRELIELLYPAGSFLGDVVEAERPPLFRPKPRYARVLLYALLTLVFAAACGVAAKYVYRAAYPPAKAGTAGFSDVACGVVSSAAALTIVLFFARKKILVWFVRLYQYYAPEEVRRLCVYTPTCSQYMILSIEKYGVIRGVYKGWRRLKRCHYPNGGEDYP